MPANLNALIRYKTINSCLYGGKRRWSVTELAEKCSEALAEARGRYKPVSERTLRDDIRVMRSDILGFNAPIRQEGGLYFYSDPHYSILTLRITDAGLAEQIYRFLLRLRDEKQHPELEILIERICQLTGRIYLPYEPGEVIVNAQYARDIMLFDMVSGKERDTRDIRVPMPAARIRRKEVLWADVMGLLGVS